MRTIQVLAALAAGAVLSAPTAAQATGMQGHMYITELAVGQLPSGELKALLDARRTHYLNGAFFPDSGYAANDPYGEIAHWEQFVEAYLQWIRATYAPPYDQGEAADHVAVMMGAAAHGMEDQVYDILFFDKVGVVDGSTDELDTGTETFLVNDLDRRENPEVVLDAEAIAGVFRQELEPGLSGATIQDGMAIAKQALGLVILVLSKSNEGFLADYPWAAAHYLDPAVPGSYPNVAPAVAGYMQNLWRRLNGDEAMDAAIIASSPAPGGVGVAVDHTSLDSYVTFFSGHGLARESITEESVFVTDAAGAVVPCEIRLRGDAWANTVQLKPLADWDHHATYTLHVTSDVRSLHDRSLPAEHTQVFTTACAPGDEASCAEVAEPSASLAEGGCSSRGGGERPGASGGLVTIAALAIAARRRRRRR
jgi:MYXO-CTERM domain-containing protein